MKKIKGSWQEDKAAGRRLTIYLPPSYAKYEQRYPVVYLQDGQDLIDPAQSDVIPRMEKMMAQHKLPELILAGVEPCHRLNDYSPWPAKAMGTRYSRHDFGGQGDLYLQKLTQLIKPHIDATYRTKQEAEHTAIVGVSLGALISLYAAYTHPQTFGKIGCLSTSIWYEGFLDYMNAHSIPTELRIYMDIGLQESRASNDQANDLLQLTERAYQQVKASGVPDDQAILVKDEQGKHRPSSFIRRLPGALQWLFD
ncbi:alpha/beta hydrolase [Paenibacillus sp. 1001270B_150601_E10]|uniref:alpha/beta hydrolase n=1 Tax=Paenibacillus sp. 1001270B_150601_E10 TaxID=2787079 RepID=UPI00189DC0FF|nr:alpha/beta hydrolase-fold protein [Paenibacillus sp. 1001270B_150601_E10]